MFVVLSRERWGVSSTKRFAFWDWGIEGTYVWCLVIANIFMGLGGAKRSAEII